MEKGREAYEGVKAGDLVVLITKHGSDSLRTVKAVERTTKTQIMVGKLAYRRSDGSVVGADGGSYTIQLVVPTKDLLEEVRGEVKRRELLRRIHRATFGEEWSNDDLHSIVQIIEGVEFRCSSGPRRFSYSPF